MAKQVSDLIVERLIEWGVDTDLRISGRRCGWIFRVAAHPSGQAPLHTGAT